MDIRNKTVLITGANRGIGAALVRALLKAGAAKIYTGARNPAALPDFADTRVTPLALDVTKPVQVSAAAQKAGDIDALINNAGVMHSADLFTVSPADLAVDMDVNFYGAVRMMQEFAPVLEKRGGGLIANVASVVSLASVPAIAGYCASKAALFSATQAARTALKPKNIRVVGIFPGPIDTDLAKNLTLDKATPDHAAEEIVKGIIAGQEDIYPDPTSKQLSDLWSSNPKNLERYFADLAA
ncbi:MAG TPA: SDR family oxidoreductase [Rhizomicrobium sp.]|jgi:NAD(P)-dependent dehydrogenase (short-subunit alcohol dehydrogenase family)|nr:SDR family oxidoreductase [Rhizomicrobium sp.]